VSRIFAACTLAGQRGRIDTVTSRPRTSDGVTAFLLDGLFDGSVRVGERLDLDDLAGKLGVSRSSVRDGITPLERDGLVRVTHHKGAFVAPFDAGTIREAFDLFGLLSALAFRRAATRRPPELIAILDEIDDALASTTDVDEFDEEATRFRSTVTIAAAGPHLRAMLGGFTGLVPAATRLSIVDAMAEERSALHAEYSAICDGDGETAATVVLDHSSLTADNAIRELRRRGVIDGDPRDLDERADHLDLVRRIDERAIANWNGPTLVGLQIIR
jgi:DNA-binding GntR family transcriptional regulator